MFININSLYLHTSNRKAMTKQEQYEEVLTKLNRIDALVNLLANHKHILLTALADIGKATQDPKVLSIIQTAIQKIQ